MDPTDLISVVTLTHNKLAYTRRCVGSLLMTAYTPWELIVVDNGSDDGTGEWLQKCERTASESGVRLRCIMNKANVGCSTARNQGLALASGGKVVFVDNDVALRSRHWLGILAERLDANPRHAMVGPKLVYPFEPYAIQCAGAAVTRSGRVQFRGRGERRDDQRFNTAGEVQCLISACCMARRSVLEDVGGFDEVFNPVEYEDIDLCYRIRDAGYQVLYEPTVEMYHFESVTTAGTATLPNTYLIIKHGMTFKQRWHRMFSQEDGPDEEEAQWREVETRRLHEVGALPIMD